MESLPDNSNAGSSRPEPDKITQGQMRPAPLGRKVRDTFMIGSARGALNDVVMDVLLPAAKDAILDGLNLGGERILLGSGSRGRRRTGAPSGGSRFNYNGITNMTTSSLRADKARTSSPKATPASEAGEVWIETRGEAEAVLEQMYEYLERYGEVKVSNLHSMVGITGDYVEISWGWTSLQGSDIRRAGDGYVLKLPRPKPLK